MESIHFEQRVHIEPVETGNRLNRLSFFDGVSLKRALSNGLEGLVISEEEFSLPIGNLNLILLRRGTPAQQLRIEVSNLFHWCLR